MEQISAKRTKYSQHLTYTKPKHKKRPQLVAACFKDTMLGGARPSIYIEQNYDNRIT